MNLITTESITRPTLESPALSGVCRLGHLGVIRAQGPDTVKFLQGQLTQDVALLKPGAARLAAFCSAKGRMQASFIVVKCAEDDMLMVLSADLLARTLKRLGMFVLRAQVRLSDESAAWQLWGWSGLSFPSVLAGLPWSAAALDGGWAICLYPAADVQRSLVLLPAGTPAPTAAPLDAALWNWLEVHSGVAMVTEPVFEAFVPQMLNYESVGGVSFKKGCYPGQEVVARSQFRGTLKRRAFLLHGPAPMGAGQEIFHSSDSEQSCGTVVASAANPGGGFDAIVSMQVSSAAEGQLHADSATGPLLTLLPLPYPLLDDI